MATQPLNKDRGAPARAVLETAYKQLVAAAKVAVGDDGKTLATAAATLDVAIEALMPPEPELALATTSCRDALALARQTRDYAQGGNIANALDPARRGIENALELLSSL